MSDDPNAREEGFYWVVLGQNPPEIAYWERGEWWLSGDAKPWQPDPVSVHGARGRTMPRPSESCLREGQQGAKERGFS